MKKKMSSPLIVAAAVVWIVCMIGELIVGIPKLTGLRLVFFVVFSIVWTIFVFKTDFPMPLIDGVTSEFDKDNHLYGKKHPATLYHGTTRTAGKKIYDSKLWMIGDSKPPGIWLTDDLETAKIYAGDDGSIVAVEVDPNIDLIDPPRKADDYYLFPVPDAKPFEEYYRIPGLKPIALLGSEGKFISTI
jgi:hypothetical protein